MGSVASVLVGVLLALALGPVMPVLEDRLKSTMPKMAGQVALALLLVLAVGFALCARLGLSSELLGAFAAGLAFSSSREWPMAL